MKKIPKYTATIVLVVAVVGALLISYKLFFIGKMGSKFDAANFVSEQEEALAKLGNQCASDDDTHVSNCVNWAEVAIAWDSEWNSKLPSLWERDCGEGQRYSCRRWESYQQALRQLPTFWTHSAENALGQQSWPRVNDIGRSLQIRDWLSVAMEGMVHGRDSTFDFVCGGVKELAETLVCVAKGNKELNSATGRVVSYIEQGKKILSIGEHGKNPLLRFWQGLNLKRDDFNYATSLLQSVGPLLPEEESLWQKLHAKNWKYLLVYNYFSAFTGVPSHEFLHGLYFASSDYRRLIDQMIESKKIPIKGVQYFVDMIFDTSDKYVKNNEIQAYLLQHSSFLQDRKSNSAREKLLNAISKQFFAVDIEEFRQGL